MIGERYYIIGIMMLVCAAGARADVLERMEERMWLTDSAAVMAYGNPALMTWRNDSSLSTLSALYRSQPRVGAFDARSYMHVGSNTLWGGASYHNGKTADQRWCEASDYHLVYPYVTADSVGGRLNMERYAFDGGWAGRYDRWALGASLSYVAGHYYRSVDPRPRNVTGTLDLGVGAAYRFATDYVAGLSANYQRYKQSNDIEFVSELGETKIYHLTGLGHRYVRFDGLGKDCNYTADRWGAQADLYGTGRSALYTTAAFQRLTMTYILTDLNKLPMATVAQNHVRAQAGWRLRTAGHRLTVAADWGYVRRLGTENIFGDPASNQYPQIGSATMYLHRLLEGGVRVAYDRTGTAWQYGAAAGADYLNSRQEYADPWTRSTYVGWHPYATARVAVRHGRWYGALSGQYRYRANTMAQTVCAYAIDSRYVLRATATYTHVTTDCLSASLSLVF